MSLLESIPRPLRDDLLAVREVARVTSQPVYLVGGPVRDALLGRPGEDLDFLVTGNVEEISRSVAVRLGGSVTTYPAFATATVSIPERVAIDFTTSRKESYPYPGALPQVEPAPIEIDLRRRDFTINALAWNVVSEEIVDPYGGRDDLERGILRILHPGSFLDDPTRLIRGARFAARLGFHFDPDSEARLKEAVRECAIRTVSVNRVWRELLKSLAEDRAEAVFSGLTGHGVMASWLGASPREEELPERVARLRDLMSRNPSMDAPVIFHALLVELFEHDQPLDVPASARKRKLALRLARHAETWKDQWTRVRTETQRARFCLEHPEEEIAFFATTLPMVEAISLIDLCRQLRELRLPFDGSSLDVAPGPHVAAALREARIRALTEGMPDEALLSFARETALRYLSGQDDGET